MKSLRAYFRRQIVERIRQYGWRTAGRQWLAGLYRPFYESSEYLLLAAPAAGRGYAKDPQALAFDAPAIARAVARGQLTEKEAALFFGFLKNGDRGYCLQSDGALSGYAWTQYSGAYDFGKSLRMTLPPGVAMIKNVYVYPEYRARGISRRLNATQLAEAPAGAIPLVVVLRENRYALRNWERWGFDALLRIRRFRRLSRYSCSVVRLADLPLSHDLSARIVCAPRRRAGL